MLETLATEITKKFEQDRELATRIEAAKDLAKHYELEYPQIILYFTHPDLAKKTLHQRCQALGITAEQYMLATANPQFKEFLHEWESTLRTTVRLQALSKVSEAIPQDRVNVNKWGVSPDYSVEKEVLQEKPTTINNTQINNNMNLFEQARARLNAK